MLEKFGEKIESGRRPTALWGKLSREWVHTEGIVTRIIQNIAQKGDLHAWALVIPINYTREDLDALNELGTMVREFREVLRKTAEKYGLF